MTYAVDPMPSISNDLTCLLYQGFLPLLGLFQLTYKYTKISSILTKYGPPLTPCPPPTTAPFFFLFRQTY